MLARSLSAGSLRSSSATSRLSMKNPIFLCSRMDGALSGWMELWTTVAPNSLPLRTHSLSKRYPISFLRKYGCTPMFSTHSRLSSSQM